MVKVKAHTTEFDVRLKKKTEPVDRAANEYVDTLAKEGAQIHVVTEALRDQFEATRRSLGLIAPFLAAVVAMSSTLCSLLGRSPTRRNRLARPQRRAPILYQQIKKC